MQNNKLRVGMLVYLYFALVIFPHLNSVLFVWKLRIHYLMDSMGLKHTTTNNSDKNNHFLDFLLANFKWHTKVYQES